MRSSIKKAKSRNSTRPIKVNKLNSLPQGVRRAKNGKYVAYITRGGITHTRTFSTIDECLAFRKSFM